MAGTKRLGVLFGAGVRCRNDLGMIARPYDESIGGTRRVGAAKKSSPLVAWCLRVAVSFSIVAVACAPAGQAWAGTVSKTPKPAFPGHPKSFVFFTVVTTRLEVGGNGLVGVRVSHRASCSLKLAGPSHLHAGPYPATVQQSYASWQWVVPENVRGGAWLATVVCRSGAQTKTLNARLLASSTASNNGAAVAHNSMTVSVGAVAPKPPSAPADAGKGGGSYPDDGALCRWTGQHSGRCSGYDWGYRQSNGTWKEISARGFYYRNCTDFVAWYEGLTWTAFHFAGGNGNAVNWKAAAANVGLQVTSHPSIGDVAWWGGEVASGYGHVGIVTAVNGDGSASVASYNALGDGTYTIRPGRADAYLHKPAAPAPPSPPTSPQPPTPPRPGSDFKPPSTPGNLSVSNVSASGMRLNWAPSTDNVGVSGYAVYLNGNEVGAVSVLYGDFIGLACGASYTLGVSAHDAAGNSSSMAAAVESTAPCPTSLETTGGVTHTWTNHANAGGTQGPTIPSNATVQIACKLSGWTAPDGNNWWYRIYQSPWNGAYYASADAFYNNGQTSGSLHGTPFVDPSVPNC